MFVVVVVVVVVVNIVPQRDGRQRHPKERVHMAKDAKISILKRLAGGSPDGLWCVCVRVGACESHVSLWLCLNQVGTHQRYLSVCNMNIHTYIPARWRPTRSPARWSLYV